MAVHVWHGRVGVAAKITSNSTTIVTVSLQLTEPVPGTRSHRIGNGVVPSGAPADDQTICVPLTNGTEGPVQPDGG